MKLPASIALLVFSLFFCLVASEVTVVNDEKDKEKYQIY